MTLAERRTPAEFVPLAWRMGNGRRSLRHYGLSLPKRTACGRRVMMNRIPPFTVDECIHCIDSLRVQMNYIPNAFRGHARAR